MKYTNFLFDLDGTLTDPKIGITKAVQYALLQKGIIVNDLSKLECFIGPPLQESFSLYYHMNEVEAWESVAAYREYFKEYGIYENELYEGITDLLKLLQSKQYQLFVATSKPTVFAEMIITYFNLNSYFVGIYGSELDGTRSNKGELIQYIMEGNQLRHDNTVMIGDRKHDLIGANNNRIDSIAVGYGYGSEAELKGENPTYYYKTIKDFIEAYL